MLKSDIWSGGTVLDNPVKYGQVSDLRVLRDKKDHPDYPIEEEWRLLQKEGEKAARRFNRQWHFQRKWDRAPALFKIAFGRLAAIHDWQRFDVAIVSGVGAVLIATILWFFWPQVLFGPGYEGGIGAELGEGLLDLGEGLLEDIAGFFTDEAEAAELAGAVGSTLAPNERGALADALAKAAQLGPASGATAGAGEAPTGPTTPGEHGGADGVDGAGNAVGGAVDGTADAVNQTVGGVTGTVDRTVEGTTDTVDRTVGGVTDTADDAVGGAGDLVGGAVDGTTDTVDQTVEGVTGTVDRTVDGTTDTVNQTVEGVTGTVDRTVDETTDIVDQTLKGE